MKWGNLWAVSFMYQQVYDAEQLQVSQEIDFLVFSLQGKSKLALRCTKVILKSLCSMNTIHTYQILINFHDAVPFYGLNPKSFIYFHLYIFKQDCLLCDCFCLVYVNN